jgi:hypothetical protein
VIAGVFILGAYLFSNPTIFAPSAANAESTQALLAAYAQKKDPNGLPLWEDQLLATASSTAWTATSTTLDTTPAPAPTAATGSLTDQFAQTLFSQYMSQEGGANPSNQDIDTFAQNAIQQLVQTHSEQSAFSETDLRLGGSGPEALKTYAAATENVVAANTVPTDEDEIEYFSDAVEKNQVDGLKEVAAIGNSYSTTATALMGIQVPSEAQAAHLEIANAMARLGTDITDMSTLETDPLRAYLGLSAYQTDATSLTQAFADMSKVFSSDQVTLTPEDSGYDFYQTSLKATQTLVTKGGTSQQ